MRIIILILLLISIYSCKQNNKYEYKLEKTSQSVTFDLPYDISSSDLSEMQIGDSLMYVFPLLETNKSIKICDNRGNVIHNISLKSLIENSGEKLGRVAIKNIDSIYLMTYYTNRIYLIDSNANVLSVKTLVDSISPKINYELIPLTFGQLFYQNQFLFYSNLKYKDDSLMEASSKEYNRQYYKKSKDGPYFVTYNNPFQTKNPVPNFQLNGFQNRYVGSENANLDAGRSIAMIGDTIISVTNLTDSIYKFAGNPMRVVQDAAVHSDYSTLKHTQLKIDNVNQDDLTHILLSQGYIRRPVYDPYRNVIYLSVFHSQNKKKDDFSITMPSWSIIILDKNLNKIGECFFEKDKYHSMSMFVNKDGLLIQRDVPRKVSAKPIFDLYELKKS